MHASAEWFLGTRSIGLTAH